MARKILSSIIAIASLLLMVGVFILSIHQAMGELNVAVADLITKVGVEDIKEVLRLMIKYNGNQPRYVLHRAVMLSLWAFKAGGLMLVLASLLGLNVKGKQEHVKHHIHYHINGELVEKENDTYNREEFKFY